jgi:prephenate dehydrogenase
VKRVCIVGVGLIGGSLGMALRRVRIKGQRVYHVTGWGRSRARLKHAKKLGAVDDFDTSPKEALASADIVVLCVPVHQLVPLSRRFLSYVPFGAILTDVGSVKKSVADQMNRLIAKRLDLSFIGAHPIAGSEKTGVQNADPKLFRGATCVLTSDRAKKQPLSRIRNMWNGVGATCITMTASRHDHFLALTSHLPHLLSFALFSLVESIAKNSPVVHSLVAGSFRDMTRIAASDPDLWTGVLKMNRRELEKVQKLFLGTLHSLIHSSAGKIRSSIARLAKAKKSW